MCGSVYPSRTSRTISRFEVLLKRKPHRQLFCGESGGALTSCFCSEAAVSSRTKKKKPRRTVRNRNFTLPATDFIFLSCFHTIGSHQRELTVYDKEVPVSWHQPQRGEQRQSCMIYNILYCRHAWRPICYFTLFFLSSGA